MGTLIASMNCPQNTSILILSKGCFKFKDGPKESYKLVYLDYGHVPFQPEFFTTESDARQAMWARAQSSNPMNATGLGLKDLNGTPLMPEREPEITGALSFFVMCGIAISVIIACWIYHL